MKVVYIYPKFERHADAHPELREFVPCNEYVGPPSLGIAAIAATLPPEVEQVFIDDRVNPFDPDLPEHQGDLYAISFFTPAATRAFEIGDALLQRGKQVVMGGIFPSMMPHVAAKHCTAVVTGEGEPVWPSVVRDAQAHRLKKVYQGGYGGEISSYPPPKLELYFESEREGFHFDDYPFQLSRGCPLQCDACVIPHYLGKKIRFFDDHYLDQTLRTFAKHGKLLSFTEDISVSFAFGARRKFRKWLDRIIDLREREGLDLKFSYLGLSMPMLLHMDRHFLTQLQRTGIDRFYLVGGYDPITRKAFGQGDEDALSKAHRVIERCREFQIDPYVSFLVGNQTDDDKVFDRMLDFASASGIELAEFAILTPYPNTPIWHRLNAENRIFDREWKHYNDANVVFHPWTMDAQTLTQGYLYLWKEFYARRASLFDHRPKHRKTIQF